MMKRGTERGLRLFLVVLLLGLVGLIGAQEIFPVTSGGKINKNDVVRANALLSHRHALFVENKGQWQDKGIRFAMRSRGANVLIHNDAFSIKLFKREDGELRSAVIKARFKGADCVTPEGLERSQTVLNYYGGSKYMGRSNVPTFHSVAYRALYDGIDLFVKANRSGVKTEFHLAPGSDWRKIAITYGGIDSLHIDDAGRVVIVTPAGKLIDAEPVIYQEIDGRHIHVAGRFRLIDSKTCGFELTGKCDPASPTIIDPDLEWSTYLGGSEDEYGSGIAVDGAGNCYVMGGTYSSDFPTHNGCDTSHNGSRDIFISKFSAAGSLIWSTYLGGSDVDEGMSIAVDGAGNCYVTGWTCSSDFPTPNGWDTSFNGGSNVFVAKFSAAGSLIWSTYLGGNFHDFGYGIAVDGAGNCYVTGATSSSDFPTPNGCDTSLNGKGDAFVSKFSAAGSLIWSTYLGGSDYDKGSGIAVDGVGNCYVTGKTSSSDFPTPGGWDTTFNGSWDVFVARLSAAGSLIWSTYLGGSDHDGGKGIAVDGAGNCYVTGFSFSSDFPTPNGWDTSFNGGYMDVFVSQFSAAGSLIWSTYLGGRGSEEGYGIAVDGAGNCYVTGETGSREFPTTSGWDTSFNGGSDVFVARFSAAGSLIWSTYLGGSSYDEGWGIAVNGAGNCYVTGLTYSSDFPTPKGWDTNFNGSPDVFVAQFSPAINISPNINLLTPPINGITAVNSCIIKWTDEDPDDDAQISLYYDTDNSGCDGMTIMMGISEDDETDIYDWDTSGILEGIYWVYAKIDDGVNPPVYAYSPGSVMISHVTRKEIVEHILKEKLLPQERLPFADLNRDGYIDVGDVVKSIVYGFPVKKS